MSAERSESLPTAPNISGTSKCRSKNRKTRLLFETTFTTPHRIVGSGRARLLPSLRRWLCRSVALPTKELIGIIGCKQVGAVAQAQSAQASNPSSLERLGTFQRPCGILRSPRPLLGALHVAFRLCWHTQRPHSGVDNSHDPRERFTTAVSPFFQGDFDDSVHGKGMVSRGRI